MASSGGTTITSSGSEQDFTALMNERKRKRMISNRESARRSRQKKQQQLDQLTSQVSQLRKENNQLISSVSITTQHYMSVEAENDILRAQVVELSHQLQSLNEIIAFCGFAGQQYGSGTEFAVDEFMVNSLSYLYANQPILASADMIQY